MVFMQKKQLCHELFFSESFIVAPLFLDICLEVFGALGNPTNISFWDILV